MEKFYEKYEKPAVLLNANVADEIYMASGSKVTAFSLMVTQVWKTGGTATCNMDLYGVNPNKLTLTTPTGKPVGFLLPSLACNRAPYEYFHRLWNTGISLFE